MLRILVYLLPKAVCIDKWGVLWGEKEIFTVITDVLLVMVSITWRLVKLHPKATVGTVRPLEHCSPPGSQASSKNHGSLRVADRRGPLARRGRKLRKKKKLDPGTYLLYKNIQVVGTGLVWAEIREYFSVLNIKSTDKKQAGSKRYKCLLMSYKAKGSR